MPAPAYTECQALILRMSTNEESTIGRVRTPTYPRGAKRPVRELRHALSQKLADALFRYLWDLLSHERRTDAHIGGLRAFLRSEPVAISGMLIADLELLVIGVRFHEEASLHIEENRKVAVEPGLFLGHLDVR